MRDIKNYKIPAIIIIIIIVIFLSSEIYCAEFNKNNRDKDSEYNQLILSGIRHLYNWEFDVANQIFRGMIAERPDDPTGYFYYSMVTWSRMASGFWDQATVNEYNNRIELAIKSAENRIERGDADSFVYFYLGGALGFKGRFELMEQKWFSSYRSAVDAIAALNTSIQMDPNNVDALLGLGIYDYYTARLSGVLKFLTYMFLHRGNKEEGLRKLHITAERALYSSTEAKSTLLYIYLFLESDLNKARPLAEELAEQFSNNPRHCYLKGLIYFRLDLKSEYRLVLQCFQDNADKEPLTTRAAIWKNWKKYLEVSYHMNKGEYDKARSLINEILKNIDPENNPYLAAWPVLKLGMTYDLENDRQQALEYYKRVLDMENGAGAQFLAQKYIDEAVENGDPFIGM